MTGGAHEAATGHTGSVQGKSPLLRWMLAGILVWGALAHRAEAVGKLAPATSGAAVVSRPVSAPSTFNTVTSGREALILRRRWGIDDLHVRSTASGSVIRFSYRVVDAERAKILNDKKAKPYLIVQKTRVKLEVPTTEKVGQLRQTAAPENGREYWMVFGNVGRTAKAGDHVDVVIGEFRANELVVESAAPRVRKP